MSARQRVLDDLAFALGIALGALVLFASGYLDRSPELVQHNDFSGFWAGPRAFLIGKDPYDPTTWRGTAIALGTQTPDTPVYGYFGWALVLLLPLAGLPLDLASALWTFGAVALAVVAVRALLRAFVPGLPIAHTLVGLTLLASQPARLTVLLGQWGFVLVAASAAIVVWLRAGRTVPPALASVALLAKPHLFMLGAPALAVWSWRRHGTRLFAPLAAGACAAVVLASVVLVPQWPRAWLTQMPSHRVFDPPQTTTIATVLYGVVGAAGPWIALGFILACAAAALRFHPDGDAWLAVWLALSSVASVYEWSYDHLVLIVPLAIATGVVARTSRRRAIGVVVAGSSILLIVSTLLAVIAARRDQESYSAIVPVLIFLLVTLSLWPARRRVDRAAVHSGGRDVDAEMRALSQERPARDDVTHERGL